MYVTEVTGTKLELVGEGNDWGVGEWGIYGGCRVGKTEKGTLLGLNRHLPLLITCIEGSTRDRISFTFSWGNFADWAIHHMRATFFSFFVFLPHALISIACT